MQKFFEKLYTGDKAQAVHDILEYHQEHGYVWVNFFYFAYITAQRLYLTSTTSSSGSRLQLKLQKKLNDFDLETPYLSVHPDKAKFLSGGLENSCYVDYHRALLEGSFLFCDGIALQLSYALLRTCKQLPGAEVSKFWPHNLNGTDFVPYFFEELKTRYGNHKLNVILYGSYPDYVKRSKEYFQRKGVHVMYYQNGYSELSRQKVEEQLEIYPDRINILLVARSHPDLPIQELRVQKHIDKIQKHHLLTFTVGGLFDHLIGAQSRCPKLIRIIKLEWLWRLITNPKRNYKKNLYIFKSFRYLFSYLLLKKR